MASFVAPYPVPLPRTSPLNPPRSLSSVVHGRYFGRPALCPLPVDSVHDEMAAAVPLGLVSGVRVGRDGDGGGGGGGGSHDGGGGGGSASGSGHASAPHRRPRRLPIGGGPPSMAAAQEGPSGVGSSAPVTPASLDVATARRASRRAARAAAAAAAVPATAATPAAATSGGRRRAATAPAATATASSLSRAAEGGGAPPPVRARRARRPPPPAAATAGRKARPETGGGSSGADLGDSSDDDDGDEWVEDAWPPAAAGGLSPFLTADGVRAAPRVVDGQPPPPLPRVRSADYLPASADEFPFNVGKVIFEGDVGADVVAPHSPVMDAGWAAAAPPLTPKGTTDGPRRGRGRPSSVGGRARSVGRPPSPSDPSPPSKRGVPSAPSPFAKESSEDDSLVDAEGQPLPDHHIRRRLSTTWRYKLRYARDLMASGAAGPARGGLENLRPYVAATAAARTCTPCDGTGMAVCSYCKGAGFVRLGGRPGARVFSITHNQSMAVLPTHVMGDTFHCPLCGGLRRERCVRCAGVGTIEAPPKGGGAAGGGGEDAAHPATPVGGPTMSAASTAGGGGTAALSLGVPTPVPDPHVGMEDYLASQDPELVERLPGEGAAIVRQSRRKRRGAGAKATAAAAAAAAAGTTPDAAAPASDADSAAGATPGAPLLPRRRGRPRKGQEASVTQPLTPLPGSVAALLADRGINTGFVNTTDFRVGRALCECSMSKCIGSIL
ncbi:hypothetical protein I4F81_000182 [Pyropia yezoensis]|uniref:Uncharacterized protein n=1 Tax=Pyropia yezoensis TaxID=2788 RepID=A0ACC3BI23_PYRYE|nr:hypothetical protein I4F81_000182 [Neopyropia yezoensis]